MFPVPDYKHMCCITQRSTISTTVCQVGLHSKFHLALKELLRIIAALQNEGRPDVYTCLCLRCACIRVKYGAPSRTLANALDVGFLWTHLDHICCHFTYVRTDLSVNTLRSARTIYWFILSLINDTTSSADRRMRWEGDQEWWQVTVAFIKVPY